MAKPGRASKTATVGEYLVSLEIDPLREGGYVATSPNLPGLVAQGDTIAATMEFARDVARKIIESHIAHGDPLPPPKRQRGKKVQAYVPVIVSL